MPFVTSTKIYFLSSLVPIVPNKRKTMAHDESSDSDAVEFTQLSTKRMKLSGGYQFDPLHSQFSLPPIVCHLFLTRLSIFAMIVYL